MWRREQQQTDRNMKWSERGGVEGGHWGAKDKGVHSEFTSSVVITQKRKPAPYRPPPIPLRSRQMLVRERERERVCSTHERYLPTGGNKKHLRSPHPFPRCRQRGRQRHMAVARSVQKFFTVMTFRWSTYMYLPSYLPTYHPLLPLFETKQKNYRIIGVSC